MQPIRFTLDGALVEEHQASPTTTLLQYLRRHRHQCGTKEGCAEGDCGACTVAILDAEAPGGPTFRAVDSCLLLLPMVHGRHVITVEGLQRGDALHPSQVAMVEAVGSQCGYCTPGIVMSLFEATYRDDLEAAWKLDDQLCGNLCRCTGYRPIRTAAEQVAGSRPDDAFAALLAGAEPGDRALAYRAGDQRFYQPGSFDDLWGVLDDEPEHRFVAGATDLGLDVTKRHVRFPCLVSLGALPALRRVEATDDGWSIGAGVRLSDLEDWASDELPVLARMLRYFGARQIKHGATLGGNLCNASPIGDTPPVLLALGAVLVARSQAGERRIPVDVFFTGYRRTALRPGEILARVEIPRPPPDARLGAYKVSKRRELDISSVCAAMAVRVDADGTVLSARLAYGGMAPTPARAPEAEATLAGHPWSEASVEAAAAALADDFTPISDHRGSAWYRATLAANLLRGFYQETRTEPVPTLPARPSGTVLAGGPR